jgi:short-subunit dehydrogenase
MKALPVIVLTGATSGLGRLAALELARKGAHLALVARNQARADALRTEIEQAAPGAKPEIFLADLSLLAEVYRVGRQIGAYYPRIDVLINNAGVHAFSQRVTSEGRATRDGRPRADVPRQRRRGGGRRGG